MWQRISLRTLCIALVVLTIGCDQVTKRIASAELKGEPGQSYFGDTLRIQYAENPGAFLSLGANMPPWARTAVFSFGSALLLGFCLYTALKNQWPRVAQVGLCLIFGGGVSNLIDRPFVYAMALMLGVAIVLLTGHRPPEGAKPA